MTPSNDERLLPPEPIGEPIRKGAYEAKTHLAELLRQVEAGRVVEITRRGAVIARIVPAAPVRPRTEELLREFAALRRRPDKPTGVRLADILRAAGGR